MSKRARATTGELEDGGTADVVLSSPERSASTPSKRLRKSSPVSNTYLDSFSAITGIGPSIPSHEMTLNLLLDPVTNELPEVEDANQKSKQSEVLTDVLVVNTALSESDSEANSDPDSESDRSSVIDSDSDYIDDDTPIRYPIHHEHLDALDGEYAAYADQQIQHITIEDGLDQLLSDSDGEEHSDEDDDVVGVDQTYENRMERNMMRYEERNHADLVAEERETYEDILSWF
ncbi:hypothetical protein VTL71DRAFT_10858 [Oculimacula yallundae]|uniref:Uncharacterized protein n=1 Tax=Oculimacula yallundae TaxID=86028 RepID=A0ABR4CVC3_9HELO